MRLGHLLSAGSFVLVIAACSSDGTSSSSSSSSSGGSSSGGSSSSSSSSTSSSGGGSECTEIGQCPKLTCTCGNFAGTSVQKCSNGVCAKTCTEAGCS